MTPKEKAQDLYAKYEDVNHMFHKYNKVDDIINHAKESALIAVDEILEEYKEDYEDIHKDIFTIYSWWKKVKQEIEAL